MKPIFKMLRKGLSGLLFAIAGLSFLFGGRAIGEFAKVDRILSEILGLGIAAAFGALGLVAKNLGRPDETEDDQDSAT